ncbi:GH92 family glycosyl hydrolase [Foetidibacter luteolus]|uniref:GH92 family glycosyl hydrolase n=1 Tax=Foetidibacter luteolus TaxID=2608880 RepID=UPI001F389017|nr:GH92 family glycosyl hydrolase [Foetidibacter luteolus]
MRKTSLLLLCALNVTVHAQKNASAVDYVDEYIGTGGHGHTFIGASVPFGAVQVGPNNIHKGWDWCSGYHYSDSVVKGFAQNHLNGTGIADLGDIVIMPYTGDVRTSVGTQDNPQSGYASYYTHKDETAKPSYYSLLLKSSGVKVELTASERVAFHKYKFPAGKQNRIIVDLFEANYSPEWKNPKMYGSMQKLDDSTIVGWRSSTQWARNRKIWFAIRTSLPLKDFVLYNAGQPVSGTSLEAQSVKGILSFKGVNTALLKVGVSNVSSENALANIQAEIPHWSFTKVVEEGRNKWNQALSAIKIETPDAVQKKIFYTALYHAMIAPALYNDHDGSYRGADDKVYTNPGFTNYTIFSLWDTYRTLNPLMTVIQPARAADFAASFMAIYRQQGKLPIWHLQGRETDCMVGYSGVPVLADAYLKGLTNLDGNEVLEAMKASSTRDDYGMKYLKETGFIPADKEKESVSKALEYAVDDWCIARVAKKLGKQEDTDVYSKRGAYYTRYFDTVTKFMRPVMSSGSFREPFSPFQSIHEYGDYTEGNAWQYTWLVPQNVEHLIALVGGDKAFTRKLDSLFVVSGDMGEHASADISGLVGMYAQGNEPNHHIPYLYAFAGEQWKTAAKIRHITKTFYTTGPEGLCGNDDAGQMSAWYVMSSLGFYPVNPANGLFVFGTPLLKKTTLQTPNGSFAIEAQNLTDKNIYIQKVLLNGRSYSKSYIAYKDIMAGGNLQFVMGPQPNKAFGSAAADRPVSEPGW